ncbi:MAG: class IV lanthionine synthetase LanL [Egibacteraceae bacterium]
MDRLSFLALLLRPSSNGQDADLADLVRAGLEREGTGGDWEVRLDGMWCAVYPPGHRMRDQGWKLHISATPSSASAVLERVFGVLVRHGCAFKVAKTLEIVVLLNSRQYSRGGGGKFMTVYPDDDEQFCRLAAELDAATAGLPGPAILSDRPYRAGSLVHYRYGGFVGRMVLSNDSDYRPMLQGPDGSLVEDRRDAWFAPPAWARSPLDEDQPAPEPAGAPEPVLLGGRFIVREAIRHSNKGGLYLGVDTQTDAEVVIKEARPYIDPDEGGGDVRDMIRHEAEMLDALAPLGIAPRKIALFEQGGHVFLAEELVAGVPLSRWVGEGLNGRPGLAWPLAGRLTRQLAELLALVHAAGLVLRDLSPNNVMVTPSGQLRLVDLELAAAPGATVPRGGTAGFAAPEQMEGAAPAAQADLYSLGTITFILATGTDCVFLEDAPPLRSFQARLEGWLDTTAEHSEAARRLKRLILGLVDPTPERRWDLERVQAFLDAAEQTPAPATPRAEKPQSAGRRLGSGDQQRLITDGVEHLLTSMTPAKQDRLWPSTCFGASTDACNVHHGAAGVLAVLTQAARLAGGDGLWGDAHDRREGVHEALRVACEWIERRLPTEPRLLPGLYFGRSGTAWALFDAARTLADEPMAQRALTFARRIPTSWPNPDVTHGVAGAGLALLYLWQATGSLEFGERAQRCADQLVATADRGPIGVVWTVPASFDSRFAGQTYYGFAHGVAGIAWFLLAAGLATDRRDCLELARAAGETLCAAARHDGDDGATWGEGPHDQAARFAQWCHGSSGVGTFLIRLWQATGDEQFRALAEMAAVAVWRGKWQASSCVCHGLAGNGEFLLDMAAALGDAPYRGWAEEFAAILFARHACRDGRIVIPDESGFSLAADYGVGLAGVVAFLLRLRHGGPRMWMAEPEPSLAAVGAGG